MVEKIFELLKQNFKNPKFYIGLCIIFIIALILFPYIDANYFYYNRVEKRINILTKIAEIDTSKIANNNILSDEYDSILTEISRQKDGSLGSVFITQNSPNVKRNKFITGALLTWVLAIMCLFMKMERYFHKFLGLVVFGMLGAGIGYISMIIPTIITPTCNYVMMPILQLVLVGILATSGNKK